MHLSEAHKNLPAKERELFVFHFDIQSELIDRVEYNVNKAVDCVVQAKGKLSSAVVQNKKGRRVSVDLIN